MKEIIITAGNVSGIDKNAKQFLEANGFLVKEYPDAIGYSAEDLVHILQNCDAVIAGLEKYTKEIIEQVPSLKLIARRGVGIDNIDLAAAREHNITITRTEGLIGSAVAELILTYLLEHARKLSLHTVDMKAGIWSRRLSEGLKGKTLGLVGFGSIAKETAIRANSFGMNILCNYRNRDLISEQSSPATYADFDTLIATSDYISINVPLTEQTRHMFHKTTFDRMKQSCVLINTARGAIINTMDLVSALESKQIDSAYIDVYEEEPCTNSPLLNYDNAFLTPHIGTFTKETFVAMNNLCAKQVMQFFNPY